MLTLAQGNADDPLTKTINRYTDMGYTFAEVSLALTAFHDEPEDQEKVCGAPPCSKEMCMS